MLALDVSRAERAVSGGMDSTCRVWKVADESQLIFRASSMAVDCCRSLAQPADAVISSANGFTASPACPARS